MIGNRSWKKILGAIFKRQHYIALCNSFFVYKKPVKNLWRYFTAQGEYPFQIKIQTPVGEITPLLYGHHDILTVNEVFCRLDYYADNQVKTIVDIGSNIGLSALYFLTRNEHSKCYLFEPDTRNIEKLRKNLTGFEDRYSLKEKAVNKNSGIIEFGIEQTGRYGGIGVNTEKNIEVEAVTINNILQDIFTKHDRIDILKMDIEGLEVPIVESIDQKYIEKIDKIYIEAEPNKELHSESFNQKQYGTVCHLINKSVSKR